MLFHEILQCCQSLRNPGSAVKQACGLAERFVVEADRLTPERCERIDSSVEFTFGGFVAEPLEAPGGWNTKSKGARGVRHAPRRRALPRRWNARVGVGSVKAARYLKHPRRIRAGLSKNRHAVKRAACGQQPVRADPSARRLQAHHLVESCGHPPRSGSVRS